MRPTVAGLVGLDYGAQPWNVHYAAGYHTGRDYRATTGTPIRATRTGRVVFTGLHGGWGSAYGYHVILDTGDIRHSYNHLSRILVRPGQTIVTGQQVGRSGATGNITGPHLHYEERNSPYSYWDHRRPQFDIAPPDVWDVSDLAYSARHEPGTDKSYNPNQVESVARALNRWHPALFTSAQLNGHWGTAKVNAYRAWQRHLNFKVVDGIPGPTGLSSLARHFGQGALIRS